MELYCSLLLSFGWVCTGEVGAYETGILVSEEAPLGYHSYPTGILTVNRDPGAGPWQMGSLTGAVASQKVTEALKGSLRMYGNHSKSVMV